MWGVDIFVGACLRRTAVCVLMHHAWMRRAVLLAALVGALFGTPQALAGGPLRTSFLDVNAFSSPAEQNRAFARARSAGATMVKLVLNWRAVAPERRTAEFEPTDPNSPGYDWSSFDRQVRLAHEQGLEALVEVIFAPAWASEPSTANPGTVRPDSVEFGRFARAAATRYNGSFLGLPRVRYWQAWGEPNRDYFLMPQYEDGRMASAVRYREMVERFSAAVHEVSPGNRVVAGGLAPLGRRGKPAPLAFMRAMLCVSRSLTRTCDLRSNPVDFDAWAHHPYTSGGPTHRAPGRDDVALGDLPDMRRVLRAAIRLGHVSSHGRTGFWVTEFSWDTNPPDPEALGMRLHSRWTAEALYRMWRNGISVVTWFRLQDDPLSVSHYQSGLYTVRWRPKRSLTAFRFPVVAFRRTGGVYVWGRTAAGATGRVTIEIKPRGRSWRRLAGPATNRYGIFSRTFRTPVRRGYVRARFRGSASLPFSLTPVADRFVNPFGCGGVIPC